MQKRSVFFLALIVFLAATYFYGMSSYGLIDPDEGRYSEIPREMIESGDYFTPRLNYVKYFEKPLMHYWLTALSFTVLGANEFSSRIVPVLAGLFSLICVYILGRKILRSSEAAYYSAMILGSSVLWFAISRINIIDMPLTLFFTLSMMSYRLWLHDDSKKWLIMFYVFMAMATLTKGLIGVVLPGGIAVIHLLLTKNFARLLKVFNPLAIIVFFAITVPLFWLTCKDNPDFFEFFFIREHFLRYTTTIHNRYEPIYFFVPIIILALVPWTGLIFGGFRTRGISYNDKIFLAVWFLVPFIFFSLSDSKLIPYILPCIPPLALLSGESLRELQETGKNFRSFIIINGVILFALILAGYLLPILSHDEDFINMKVPAYFLASSLLVFFFASCFVRGRKYIAVVMSALAILSIFAASPAFQKVAENSSRQNIALRVSERIQQDNGAKVVAYRSLMQGLSFYLQRRTIIAQDLNELEFGAQSAGEEASKWFINREGLQELCRSDEHVYIFSRGKNISGLLRDLSGDIKLFDTNGHDYVYVNF